MLERFGVFESEMMQWPARFGPRNQLTKRSYQMRRQMFVMFAALAAIVMLSGLRAQAQDDVGRKLYDPNEPGSVLVFPAFVRGTVATGVPATEIEISAHCPIDLQPCAAPGTSVRLLG